MKTAVTVFCALLVLAGCAARPVVPSPVDEHASVLGMYLEVRVSGLATYRADVIYFVRRCQANETCDDRLIPSSYGKDGRVYLLNAEPGEYLAVATAFESGMLGDRSIYFAYFPDALANASAVTLKRGGQVFAGGYKLFASMGLCPDNAEPGQLKYAQVIEPDTPKCGFWKPLAHKLSKGDFIFIGGKAYSVGQQTFHYRGTTYEASPDHGDAAAFFTQAQGDLGGAGWRLGP